MRRHTVFGSLLVLCGALLVGTPVATADEAGGGWTDSLVASEKHRLAYVGAPAIRTSRDGQIVVKAFVEREKGTSYGLWEDCKTQTPKTCYNHVSVIRSDNGGRTWGEKIIVSPELGGHFANHFDLAMSDDGQRLVVIWDHRTSATGYYGGWNWAGPAGLQASISSDGGRTWSSPYELEELVAGPAQYPTSTVTDPTVAISGDGLTIVATYRDYIDNHATLSHGGGGVYSRVYRDGVWSERQLLSDASRVAFVGNSRPNNTHVSSTGDRISVFFKAEHTNGRLMQFLSRSVNGGATWSSPEIVSRTEKETNEFASDMSADGRHLALLYTRPVSSAQMWLARSDNYGDSFRHTKLSGNNAVGANVDISDDGERITALWSAKSGSNYVVQSRSSSNGGDSWGSIISQSSAHSAGRYHYHHPQLVGTRDGLSLAAVWIGRAHVESMLSEDGGQTWSDVRSLHEPQSGWSPWQARVAIADSGSVNTVWQLGEDNWQHSYFNSANLDRGEPRMNGSAVMKWITRTLPAARASHSIPWPSLPDIMWGEQIPELPATSSAGAPITYTSQTQFTCDIQNGVVVMYLAGRCTIAGTSGSAWFEPIDELRQFNVEAVPPGPPTEVTTTASENQVTVAWTAPTDFGGSFLSGHRVEVSTDAGVNWSEVQTTSHTTEQVDVTGLANEVEHLFRVVAISFAGETPSAATTPAIPFTTPSAPSNLQVNAGDGSADLSWAAPASDGGRDVTDYEYSIDGGDWVSLATADTSGSISGLVNGQTYQVRVRAVNEAGASDVSEAKSFTPVTKPDPPVLTSVTAGDGSAVVVWREPDDNGGAVVIDYEYRLNGSGGWTALGDTVTTTTLKGLSAGKTYGVEIRAVNSAGYSTPSNQIEITLAKILDTPETPPSANPAPETPETVSPPKTMPSVEPLRVPGKVTGFAKARKQIKKELRSGKLSLRRFMTRLRLPQDDGGSPVTLVSYRVKVSTSAANRKTRTTNWSGWRKKKIANPNKLPFSLNLSNVERLRTALVGSDRKVQVKVQVKAHNKVGPGEAGSFSFTRSKRTVTLPANG